MRVALARRLNGIDSVELGEWPDPIPASGQVLVRVHGAGVGPWDVGFLGGGLPGIALPFAPGQEVAGVVEAVGAGAGLQPGERVYGSLFPAGGGFAELALASADRLAPMPGQMSFQEAAGLVIGAATAYEGLIDRGTLQAGETVLITATAGGVGSAAQLCFHAGDALPAPRRDLLPHPGLGCPRQGIPRLARPDHDRRRPAAAARPAPLAARPAPPAPATHHSRHWGRRAPREHQCYRLTSP
jgi:D-arabinose 1-dehydrogenase-like Zn-dependent alcohol dehydrogenase